MSWDATLYAVTEVTHCPECGHELAEPREERSEVEWFNFTHNTNAMIAAAFEAVSGEGTEQCGGSLGKVIGPAWWRKLDGASGAGGAEYLGRIIAGLEADPARFRAMNPPNGWGSYDDLLEVLCKMREAVPEDEATVWHASG